MFADIQQVPPSHSPSKYLYFLPALAAVDELTAGRRTPVERLVLVFLTDQALPLLLPDFIKDFQQTTCSCLPGLKITFFDVRIDVRQSLAYNKWTTLR